MNNPGQYTRTAIALHWVLAALILGNLAWGLNMVDLPLSPTKLKHYSWHKWAGVTVFLLAAIRLGWRLAHPAPAPPDSMPSWERGIANASHVLLYLLFFAAPVTGWLSSSALGFQTVYFGVLPIPDLLSRNKELGDLLKLVHKSTNYTLAAMVALHTAAAIKHHVLDHDDVLARMLPFLKPKKAPE